MSDPRALLARYALQRRELGEPPLIFDPPLQQAARAGEPGPTPKAAVKPGRAAGTRAAPGPKRSAQKPPGRGGAGDAEPRWRRDLPPIPPVGITVSAPASDLFSDDPLARLDLGGVADRARTCTRCRLGGHRTNAVPGEGPGSARLVVVGEGPGATEDETGRPFVGRAGELLTEILAAIDLPREQVFICNVLKCRPPENRTPLPDEIQACVPFLYRQLEIIRPAVILAMGATAATTLLDTRQGLGALRGQLHEFRGMPVVVTYHPAALLRNPNWKKPTWDDVRIARQLVERSS